MLFCSWGTAERLTAELSAVRDQLCQKEQELRVATEKLKEKEEMLRAIGEGGTTPELLLELHQQNTLNDFPPSSCSTQTFRMAAASKVSMLFAAFALPNDAHDPFRQGLSWRRPPYADVFHTCNRVCGCLEGHGHLYKPNQTEDRSLERAQERWMPSVSLCRGKKSRISRR